MNDAQKKEYFWENTTIGVQSNFFDIVNLWENSLHDINANENGAYTQTRNTSTIFYCNNRNVRTVYKYVQKLHYNKRASFNNYQKIYVYKEYVVTLHRPYWKAKSFPLKKIAVTTSHPTDGLIIPYASVSPLSKRFGYKRNYPSIVIWQQQKGIPSIHKNFTRIFIKNKGYP